MATITSYTPAVLLHLRSVASGRHVVAKQTAELIKAYGLRRPRRRRGARLSPARYFCSGSVSKLPSSSCQSTVQLYYCYYHSVVDMSAMLRLPWRRPLPSNGALCIQQLWASGGRTREPNLMKFGTQQQIRTTMTVT